MQGLLLFYKPVDWRNKDILKFFQKTFGRDIKIGHSGTLDPFARGLMVMGLGRKFTRQLHDLLLHSQKEYISKIEFGKISSTLDVEGDIKEIESKTKPSLADIKNIIEYDFLGEKAQIPPIFSAKKHKGKRLRDIADNADIEEIARSKTKNVTLYGFEILSYQYPYLEIKLLVSSGYYIRSFGNDLGKKLGVGAYTKELKRTKLGEFSVDNAILPTDIERSCHPELAEGSPFIELWGEIFGNVQGVGLRYFSGRLAEKFNISGYIKNTGNNSVEFCAQGDLNSIINFQTEILQVPATITISDYKFIIQKPKKLYKNFEITL